MSQPSKLPRKAFCSLNHSAHITLPTFFLIATNFLNRCLPFDKWMLHSSEEESDTFPHLDRHTHLPVHLRRSQVGSGMTCPFPVPSDQNCWAPSLPKHVHLHPSVGSRQAASLLTWCSWASASIRQFAGHVLICMHREGCWAMDLSRWWSLLVPTCDQA